MSSGKWYPYHSLQAQRQGTARPHARPRPPAPRVSPLTIQPGHGLPGWGAFGAVLSLPVLYRQPEDEQPVVSVGRKPAPLLPPGDPPHRTRMEKVLMSLSSWSSRLMDWMIMLSTRFTLNFTLARE